MPIGSFYTDISNKIITPVPNRVKIWNAFTGKPDNTFAPVSDAEISAIQLDQWQKRVIVGDTKGRTKVFNAKNGALMKTLAEHQAEVNGIAQSSIMKIIVTVSLDMSMIIHEDKELTDTQILQKVNRMSSIINCIQLLPWLDICITGSSEGIIQPWDPDQQYIVQGEGPYTDSNTMYHDIEINYVQQLSGYPLILVFDVDGYITMWALSPLPYKYNKIVTTQNLDEEGAPAQIMVTQFNCNNNNLYTADEKGFIKAFDLNEVLYTLDLVVLSMDGKSNKTMSMASKAQFQPPEIDPEAIYCLFQVKAHAESIKHLHFITDPETLVSTGYDKRVRLFDCNTKSFVGMLQQGNIPGKVVKRGQEPFYQ